MQAPLWLCLAVLTAAASPRVLPCCLLSGTGLAKSSDRQSDADAYDTEGCVECWRCVVAMHHWCDHTSLALWQPLHAVQHSETSQFASAQQFLLLSLLCSSAAECAAVTHAQCAVNTI